MFKTIIFDFDGTLVNSFPVIWEIYQKFAADYGLPLAGDKEKDIYRSHHPAEIMKQLQIPMFKLLFFLKKGREEFKTRILEVKLFPGLLEVLNILKKQGFKLGIVSSDSQKNISTFLKQNNLADYFSFIYTELSLFGKHKVLKKVIKRYNLNPVEICYLGDEVRDIEAAHKAGIKIIAVSWGFNSAQFLLKYKPEYLAREPREILKIINSPLRPPAGVATRGKQNSKVKSQK